MSDFIRPESLNWTSILNRAVAPPQPLLGSPVALLPAAVLVLAFWFWRNRALGALGPILAIAVEEQPQPGGLQIPPVAVVEEQPQPGGLVIPAIAVVEEQPQPGGLVIPAIVVVEDQPRQGGLQIPATAHLRVDVEQPSWVGAVCDAGQVAAAIRAICDSFESQIPHRVPQLVVHSDSDYDGSGSTCSGHRDRVDEYLRYPPLHRLETEGACIVIPNSISRLEEMLRGLPEAERKGTLRRACPRFCDALENPLILHIDPEAFSDPSSLTKEKAKNWIMKLKVSSKIICMTWDQLCGQNYPLYQELKEECFAELADQLMKNLLNLGSSFSDASWSASDTIYMLPIFDALGEVLYSMQQLSLSRFEKIHSEITDICRKMVNHFSEIVGKTAHKSKKSDIHPATEFLIQALKFFYHNGVVLQAVLGPVDYIDDLYSRWVLKLEQDAGIMFENEKDRQYIFILNNTWFVWQKRCDSSGTLSIELANRVDSLNQGYINSYLNDCWVPLLIKQGPSSLDKFSEDFYSLCSRQGKWKVLTELKRNLHEGIINIGRRSNSIFSTISCEQPTNSASYSIISRLWKKPKKQQKQKKIVTVSDFETDVKANIFER